MTIQTFLTEFRTPILVLLGIIFYIPLLFMQATTAAVTVASITILVGSYELILETFHSLRSRQFALDYIAILAIIVSLITKEYLVGMVIALMISTGRNLEDYGVKSAKQSLTKLIDRIPRNVTLWTKDHAGEKKKVEEVRINEEILIRKGEVIPLDGNLVSKQGLTDESSLTGEPYPVEKIAGDAIRSGTINVGELMVVRVAKEAKDSTYKKIIALVEKAQSEKAPLVRLANKYSIVFTVITAVIATAAYVYHPQLESVLAVLVVATPCPLILATPIALLAGVNKSARERIIVKKLASLEILSKVNAIIFDKTGTITLGKPKVTQLIRKTTLSEEKLLAIAEAIERNSLHPLAKAIVLYAKEKNAPILRANSVSEHIGKGIRGKVDEKEYLLAKVQNNTGMQIGLSQGKKLLAIFQFEDEIKADSREIMAQLEKKHISLSLFTGDKKEAAEKVVAALDGTITVKAECTPEDKQNGINALKKNGKITAMVGDGINDAPALALADVGMVFSNEEQTAASEAADVIFLGGSFSAVSTALLIAQKTIGIAMQSILWGIGLSVLAMIGAAAGFIPPLFGAGIQEAIDLAVILNALRAAK